MTKQKPSQIDKFKQAASESEADMDEKSFDEAVGKVAKQPARDEAPTENPKGAKPPQKSDT